MKSFFRILRPLLLATPIFVSCSKDYQSPKASDKETESNVSIEMLADIGNLEELQAISTETGKPLPKSEARVFFDDQGAGNGVNFGYRAGEQLKGVLFFKRGSETSTQEVSFTVENNDDKASKYKVKRHTITLPSNIANASGALYISGAIGVIRKGNSSRVTIPNPGVLRNTHGNYSVPMYFPLTRVDIKPKSFFKTTFKVYGSLIGFNAKNKHNTKYLLKELDLKSKVFDTEGEMDINTTDAPQWYRTQSEKATKTVELISRNNTVAAKSSRPFVFWVKPTAETITAQNNQIEIGLKSFVTTEKPNDYDGGLPEAKFNIPVKKALQESRVHRIPELAIPLPGELIITEVFRGGAHNSVAIELYNSSDVPVNLYDYKMRSFKPETGEYLTSELLTIENGKFRVLVDNTSGYYKLIATSAKKVSHTDATSRYYMLPPKTMAMFIGANVVVNVPYMRERNNLRYVFNMFWDNAFRGFYLYEHGYIELIKKRTRTSPERVVDVFLKMNEQGGRQPHGVGSYTMMRKPDRNLPRLTMTQGSNSDWVSRYRTENMDWGYRFGFEYGYRPQSHNNIWFDLQRHGRANGELETGGVSRPLTYLNTDPSNAGFLHSWEQGARTPYTVPTWWTRASGVAH